MALSYRAKAAMLSLGVAVSAGLWSLSQSRPDFSKLLPAVQASIKKEHDSLAPRFESVKNQLAKGDVDVAYREYEMIEKSLRSIKDAGYSTSDVREESQMLGKCFECLKDLNENYNKYESYVNNYLSSLTKDDLKNAMAYNEKMMGKCNDLIKYSRSNLLSVQVKSAFFAAAQYTMLDVAEHQVKCMKSLSYSNLKFSSTDATILAKSLDGNMKSGEFYLRQLAHR